ncbi:MAG: oligopeptide:H+ symporter [Thermoanaerobaculales bacterium]|jgi:amino acid/peptide:H+ symporter|nr:oligopeptide:H+ symporter [Thermoanaerobaculales bacterium]
MAFGHPKGLFPLFFTEMWERLAFYTMVGILLLYTIDAEQGGLGLPRAQGNEIYGLYLAFVYFTPFLGGMIADRFLGYRRSVAIGGLLMAGGLFLMGIPGFTFFVMGLIGLIVGNGFFKPNISVMVGNLYQPGDPKRDSGFNIFYMGINIGALAATLIVAPIVRNYFGWLWTFRAAGFGVLFAVVLLAIFWKVLERADRRPKRVDGDTRMGEIFLKILAPAFIVGILGYIAAKQFHMEIVRPSDFGFLVGMIPVVIFFVRLGLTANEEERPGLLALLPIFVAGGAFFMILHLNGSAMTQWARDFTDRRPGAAASVPFFDQIQQDALPSYYVNASEDVPRPHPDSLLVVSSPEIANQFGQNRMRSSAVATLDGFADITVERIGVEGTRAGVDQAWLARAVKVYADDQIEVRSEKGAHGEDVITVALADRAVPRDRVVLVRETAAGERIPVFVVAEPVYRAIYDGYRNRFGREPDYLPPGRFLQVVNAEVYQSWNPFWVIVLTPLVVWFFGWRVKIGKAVPTAHKLLYGMLLTTASLLIMAIAGSQTDGGAVKVAGLWMAVFYLVITFGELCLSPIGLSLVTKLAPPRLVGLAMGGWFLATSIGNKFSGFLGSVQNHMEPMWFFIFLAGLAAAVATFIFLVLPRLDRAIKKYGA